ncbi:MAG: hypothetical protein U0527_08675 [Candidatus Eisenbacteria bacterium]
MLRKIEATPDLYDHLERMGQRLEDGLAAILRESPLAERIAATVGGMTQARVGSYVTLFFAPGPLRNWDEVKRADVERFGRYFRGMLARGVYLAPSQFETAFLSYAHREAEIDLTLNAAKEALREAFSE